MPDDQILIVDDTPVSLKLTKILIAREGYRVLTATTAEEALDLIHRHLPALVLTDVMLPEIDGLELTRRIKQDERTRGIRVIALSACDQAEDERRALAAGCEAYLRKPVDTATLGAWIRTFLRGATPPAT